MNSPSNGSNNRLTRDKRNGMFAGVCAGIANHMGWSYNGTRVAYVLVSLLSAAFPGLLVYLILWLVLPAE